MSNDPNLRNMQAAQIKPVSRFQVFSGLSRFRTLRYLIPPAGK